MYLICISILSVLINGECKSQTKLYLIPALHGFHKQNNNYTYDSLRLQISRLKPDIIAVEIRKTDMPEDTSYLKKNYPFEMWMMPYWFPGIKMEGFDWLGNDIEGKRIPENYWIDISSIKKAERELSNDLQFSLRCQKCDSLNTERIEILKNSSLNEILNSKDAILCNQYHDCISAILTGSAYELIPKFNRERNNRILENIIEIKDRNPGKTIVVVTGDDHYVYIKSRIAHESNFLQ